MNEKQIDILLKDVKIDKERVKKSIFSILHMYKLKLEGIHITRRKVDPSEIFVAAIEECDLEDAKEILKEKYSKVLPAPITILEYKNKKVLFMGSNRSMIFILEGKLPDCIIVKIPDNMKEPILVSEAKYTLKQIVDRQK